VGEAPAAPRQPLEAAGHDIDQQMPTQKSGALTEGREDLGAGVERGSPPYRASTRGERDEQAHGHRERGEGERVREPLSQELDDRPAGADRRAEVPRGRPPDKVTYWA